MKQPRPALFDAKPPAAGASAAAEEATPDTSVPVGKGKKAILKTSLYLDPAVHDVLREIAFHERLKVHDLIVEGVEHVLKSRRHPSIAEITNRGMPS